MSANAKFARILTAAAVALLFCSPVLADDLLYSLPETSGSGVNNTGETGGQTNVAYNAAENSLSGSMLGGDVSNLSPYGWIVDTITVWAVDAENMPGESDTPTEPSSISSGNLVLSGGLITSGTSPYGSTSIVSSGYTVAAAPYSGSSNGTNYLAQYGSNAGSYDGVWALTFNVGGLYIASGQTFAFGVGDSSSALNNDASDLALNATLCNGYTDYPSSSACVSDGIAVITGGQITEFYNYADTGVNGIPSPDNLISADVDIELDGSSTPEPATFLLLGAGVGVLGLVRRRRRG